MRRVRKIHNVFGQFLSDGIRKICQIVCYSQAIQGDQKCHGPAQYRYLFYFFQNHLGLGRSPLLKACKQCPKELTAGKEIGTQNREKNAITRPLSQISWLRHWLCVREFKGISWNSNKRRLDSHEIFPVCPRAPFDRDNHGVANFCRKFRAVKVRGSSPVDRKDSVYVGAVSQHGVLLHETVCFFCSYCHCFFEMSCYNNPQNCGFFYTFTVIGQ